VLWHTPLRIIIVVFNIVIIIVIIIVRSDSLFIFIDVLYNT
jgi:hypothetical protein